MSFKAAIYDLDGVIVDTVPLHFRAWKKMFGEYGIDFTFDEYKEKVDGIPRTDGARAVLRDLSAEELRAATARKQQYYLDFLKSDSVAEYTTTRQLIKKLRSVGVKIAIISSSKNCPLILKTIDYYPLVDAEINGNDITKGKPDPQIFLMAAEQLGATPAESIVFEDATLGVEAAKRGGFACVGIDRHNDPARLKKADLIVTDLSEVDYEKLSRLLDR